ncbi:hypothetical protein NKDENANG_00965 [Candidatus Entotheonellaceae bacterium PAL068K]
MKIWALKSLSSDDYDEENYKKFRSFSLNQSERGHLVLDSVTLTLLI